MAHTTKPRSRTINLTRIKEGNYYENLLQKEFTYDREVRERLHVQQEYLEQRKLTEELHQQRFVNVVSNAIEGVKNFVTKSLDLNGTALFNKQSEQIHGEQLLLDMHISDHEMTFVMIEKAVKKLVPGMHTLRFKAHQAKKRSITDLMEPCRQAKRVFIIIEQAESLSRVLTEALVGHLKNRLSDETSPTDAIMVLFCLSLSQLRSYPFNSMHCFGRMKGIRKHDVDDGKLSLYDLLRSRNLKVKLSPETLDFINLYSTHEDPSITSIKYLHCFSIFEHYHSLYEDDLLSEKDFKNLEHEHQSLCDDLQCLAIFLQEKDKWPLDVTDIYEELGLYDDLAESEEFFNACQGIKKIPHDRLVARLERVEKEFGNRLATNDKHPTTSTISILLSYKDKIANNKDCQDIVKQMIDDIMNYAQTIQCSICDRPNFYFNGRSSLIAHCLTSSRSNEMLRYHLNENTYYGVLLNKILHSTGQIAAAELFDEVSADFKRIMSLDTIPDTKTRQEPSSQPSPPKRSRRLTTIRATRRCKEHNGKQDDKDDERDGLARAIFVDMIDSMEHQGIVKLDPRTRGKVIKRLAWPIPTTIR
jgi:hypothetical protein